jgi:hypothetical protein
MNALAKNPPVNDADKPHLELKKIKYSDFASQETHCYQAELWVNGKLAAHVTNEGHGGNDNVYPVNKELLEIAQKYCKSLPPVESEYFEDGLPMDLELWCGEALENHLKQKDIAKHLKRRDKDMLQCIVVGDPNHPSLAYRTFKYDKPFAQMDLTEDRLVRIIIDQIKRIKATLKEGEQILNTNLPEHILNAK